MMMMIIVIIRVVVENANVECWEKSVANKTKFAGSRKVNELKIEKREVARV